MLPYNIAPLWDLWLCVDSLSFPHQADRDVKHLVNAIHTHQTCLLLLEMLDNIGEKQTTGGDTTSHLLPVWGPLVGP